MAATYDIGDVVRIASVFTQVDVPIDPTTVSVSVKPPTGATVTYSFGGAGTIIKDTVGRYHVDISIPASGTYRYRWVSTGTGAAAKEGWFQVRMRQVA